MEEYTNKAYQKYLEIVLKGRLEIETKDFTEDEYKEFQEDVKSIYKITKILDVKQNPKKEGEVNISFQDLSGVLCDSSEISECSDIKKETQK